MSNAAIPGIIERLAEILQDYQNLLSEIEAERHHAEEEYGKIIEELADRERAQQAKLREIELTRRTLLDLQEAL